MSEHRAEDNSESEEQGTNQTSSRNPFEEKGDDRSEGKPALIKSQRSAAFLGVAAGLVALLLIVGICVLGSYAFG